MGIVLIARKLQDSPHPIAMFNQHVILSRFLPEYRPKDRFPTDMDILINSDVINDDNDDETAGLPINDRLPDNHLITNDASAVQPDANLTRAAILPCNPLLRNEVLKRPQVPGSKDWMEECC